MPGLAIGSTVNFQIHCSNLHRVLAKKLPYLVSSGIKKQESSFRLDQESY